jgi:hypothetical protein
MPARTRRDVALSDPGHVGKREGEHGTRQIVRTDGHKAIGLFHLRRSCSAADLGEEFVGTQPDGAGEGRSDSGRDDALHPFADDQRQPLLRRKEGANHFVDRADGLDRQNRFDGGDDLLMQRHVTLGTRRHHDDAGALAPRVPDAGSALDPESFRFPADGDETLMLRGDRDDSDRLATKLSLEVLLRAREEGTEIDKSRSRLAGLRIGIRFSRLANKE